MAIIPELKRFKTLKKKRTWFSVGDIALLLIYIALFWALITPKTPGFLLTNSFPWLELIVILVSLRYGFGLSLIFLVGLMFLTYSFSDTLHLSLKTSASLFVGYAISALICSEFKRYWDNRIKQFNERNSYTHQELEKLVYQYAILQISHQRLEESLINKPVSLREALTNINKLLASSSEEPVLTPEIAYRYLQLLAYYCSLEKASLFLMEEANLSINPIASIGMENEPLIDDILIEKCLKTKQTVYAAVNTLTPNEFSNFLAVVPFKNSQHDVLGLLVIKDMPFLNLTHDTLQQLSMLLAYIADSYSEIKISHTIAKLYPLCPRSFISTLIRMHYCAYSFDLDSTLFLFTIQGEKSEETLKIFLQQKRGLDCAFHLTRDGLIFFVILLPLTSLTLGNLYINRLRNILQSQLDIVLNEGEIKYTQIAIQKAPTSLDIVKELFDEMDAESLSVVIPAA